MLSWLQNLFRSGAPGTRWATAARTWPPGTCGTSGYKIIVRNYRCEVGEIDIVARDGRTIVFVEVKSRAYDDPTPEDQVNEPSSTSSPRPAKVYLGRYGPPSRRPGSTWWRSSGRTGGTRSSGTRRTRLSRRFE